MFYTRLAAGLLISALAFGVVTPIYANEIQSSDVVKTDDTKIQTLTEQTMIIRKVFGDDVKTTDLNSTNLEYKGINDAEFKVYDITDLMTQTIADLLGMSVDDLKDAMIIPTQDDDSDKTVLSDDEIDINGPTDMTEDKDNPVDSGFTRVDDEMISKVHDLMAKDSLRTELLTRAQKLSQDQLTEFVTVTTAHDSELNADGIAKVKLPLDNKYHAYYVVNTKTAQAQYATDSEPFVVITPVTNDDGLWSDTFTIYPKSEEIPKPTPVKMVQTGVETQNWFDRLVDTIKSFFG